MTNRRQVSISFTPPFRKAFKQLAKKYPHISDDLKSLTDQLEQGETPGDQIPGAGYTVYKARVQNTDTRHGTCGGYRVLYYIQIPRNGFSGLYSFEGGNGSPSHRSDSTYCQRN